MVVGFIGLPLVLEFRVSDILKSGSTKMQCAGLLRLFVSAEVVAYSAAISACEKAARPSSERGDDITTV